MGHAICMSLGRFRRHLLAKGVGLIFLLGSCPSLAWLRGCSSEGPGFADIMHHCQSLGFPMVVQVYGVANVRQLLRAAARPVTLMYSS